METCALIKCEQLKARNPSIAGNKKLLVTWMNAHMKQQAATRQQSAHKHKQFATITTVNAMIEQGDATPAVEI